MTKTPTPATAIEALTNRFLAWKLPENFRPDGGIRFNADYNNGTEEGGKHQPSGTNLFDFTQARDLIKYLLDDADTAEASPIRRMHIIKDHCELRDDRWTINIEADEDGVNIRVKHRKYGDWDTWPEAVFDQKVPAALRAYDMTDNEVTFRTLGKAKAAANAFLKSYGDGEVEHLEWDIDSQSMVVTGHNERRNMWWPESKPDALAAFFPGDAA